MSKWSYETTFVIFLTNTLQTTKILNGFLHVHIIILHRKKCRIRQLYNIYILMNIYISNPQKKYRIIVKNISIYILSTHLNCSSKKIPPTLQYRSIPQYIHGGTIVRIIVAIAMFRYRNVPSTV